MASTKLYNKITVDVTINPGNIKPAVNNVHIVLEENKIPTITLGIDPVHTAGAAHDATTPTIGGIKGWLDKFQAYAATRNNTCSVDIEVLSRDDPADAADKQVLHLRNWVMTSAGMGSVGGTGNVMIELVLQHPACKLDQEPAGYELFSATALNRLTGRYKDIVDGFDKFYESALAEIKVAPKNTIMAVEPVAQKPAALYDWFAQTFVRLRAALAAHLKWSQDIPGNAPTYSGFPLLHSCLARYGAELKETLAHTIAANMHASPWSLLVDGLANPYGLSVIPTYWEQTLQVTPFTPWASPATHLYTYEITEIALPGTDFAEVGGVVVEDGVTPIALAYTLQRTASGETDQRQTPETTYVGYVPDQAKTKETPGRIIRLEPPGWLLAITAVTLAELEAYATTGNTEDSAKLEAAHANIIPVRDYRTALLAVAKQVFLSQYRNMVEAVVRTPLRLRALGSHWPNNYVTACGVIRIVSNTETPDPTDIESFKTLLDMYTVKVTHELSVDPPRAHTLIHGRYCRPEGGIPGVVSTPTYNPMYT